MTESSSVVGAIKQVMPAVVSIMIAKTVAAIEKEIPPEMLPLVPFEKGHLKIPQELVDSHGMVNVGGGSGFIVDAKGIVVTNKHVVADSNAIYTVVMNTGKKYEAIVLARDPIEDVAILKMTGVEEALPVVSLGDSSNVDLGETVLAIGNALGLFRNTVSCGIISGLSRSIRANNENDVKNPFQELRGLIQTDAAINPGNSGGPLVNLAHQAIGINAAIVFGAQNLGFALPINAVKRDLEDLKTHGRIRRPLLGFRYLIIDEGLKHKMHLPVSEGALILGNPHAPAIIPKSPADKAGLHEKDIILECNKQALTSEKTVQDFLEEREVGDKLHLKVQRGSRQFEVDVILAERK